MCPPPWFGGAEGGGHPWSLPVPRAQNSRCGWCGSRGAILVHGGQIPAPVHDPWREALKSPTRQWEEIQKAPVVSLGTPQPMAGRPCPAWSQARLLTPHHTGVWQNAEVGKSLLCCFQHSPTSPSHSIHEAATHSRPSFGPGPLGGILNYSSLS